MCAARHTGEGRALYVFAFRCVHYGVSYQNPIDIFRGFGSVSIPQLPAGAHSGLDFYGECRPAGSMSGDFFDFTPLEILGLSISIGQVSGDGAGGGILKSGLQALLRSLTRQGSREVAAVVRELNHAVWLSSSGNFSASLFCAEIDPASGEMQYVNAGHEPALLIRRRTGRAHRLESTGAVLGLSDRASYGQRAFPLEAGDLVIACTDGITEAQGSAGREFGDVGILKVVERFPDARAVDLTWEILAAAERHTGRERQSDDQSVIVARFKGAAAQTEPLEEQELAAA